MSIWKSPVFYFGVFLAFAVACLLAAPFVINWNAWKPEMEAYGRQLTGRDVTIDGTVEVRLFPWPKLLARDVRLANADGFGEAPLLAANAVTLRLSLAGLFSGTLQVEEIAFDGPDFNLARSEDGGMNWNLSPARGLSGLLKRVKLDQITVRQGSIWFDDRMHGQSASLTDIDANIAGSAIEGPWRMQGEGKWRDTPVDLAFTLAAVDVGKPLRLSGSARPQDAGLPAFVAEGEWDGATLFGKLRVLPQEATDEKASIDAVFKPMTLQSDFAWAKESLRFDNIRIAPADTGDNATLVEGSAKVALSAASKAQLELHSSRVNLDTVLGASALTRWNRGGLLDLSNGVLAGLPEKLVAEFALDVDRLTLGGETLDSVKLRGVAEKQAIRIHEAVANLPGRSRVRFDGVIFPSGGVAELGGALAFESFDLRDFAGWARSAWKPDITRIWTGARGRLKLQSNVNWSLARLSFRDAEFELDGQPGTAQVTWRYGEVPAAEVQLTAKSIDLDSYVGRGRPAGSSTVFNALSALPPLLDVGQFAEQRVVLSAESLRFNGQTASDLSLDYDAGLSGLQIKSFGLGIAGAATVKGEGLVTNGQDGPLGELEFDIAASDPRAALQLLGVVQPETEPRWTALLGDTAAKLAVQIEPEDRAPRIGFSISGTSADLAFTADGKMRQTADAADPQVEASFELAKPEFATAIATWLNRDMPETLGRATLGGSLSGTRLKGLDADLALKSTIGNVSFKGRLVPDKPFQDATGTIDVTAPSLARIATLAKAPFTIAADSPLVWQGSLAVEEGALRIRHVKGEAAGGGFDVSAAVDGNGRVSAEIETGSMRLGEILAAATLPWRGTELDLTDGLATPAPKGLQGELFIRPRILETGFGPALQEAVVAIDATGNTLAMNVKTPGKGLSFDIQIEPKGSSFAITGQGEADIDLPQVMRKVDGAPVASGRARLQGSFSSTGQSPAAVIASLNGNGEYWVENFALTGVTADGFAEGLSGATTQDALSAVFDRAIAPPGTQVGTRTGAAKLAGGALTIAPFGVNAGNSELVLAPVMDFNGPAMTVLTTLASRARPELPPLTVTFEGIPGALDARVGNAALAAKLGYELLAQELAALEKLQQEQAEVLRRQEQQRKDDEDRFAAFQAQRAELRGQLRLLRFQQQERDRAARQRDAETANAVAIGSELNKLDVERALRLQNFLGSANP